MDLTSPPSCFLKPPPFPDSAIESKPPDLQLALGESGSVDEPRPGHRLMGASFGFGLTPSRWQKQPLRRALPAQLPHRSQATPSRLGWAA